jgi:hypothetical protein
MKKLTLPYFLVLLFSTATMLLKAQPTRELLSKWKDENPQEKVYVQTDKSQYFGGETIWIKAWCVLDGAPTFLSKILYIDIVNDKGDVIDKKMCKIDSLGSVAAEIDLDATIASGKYAINAYTLWMLNFPNYIFTKNIYVYNGDYKNPTILGSANNISLQFFPEGGDMVAGLKNRIAFKATNANGLPIQVSGTITDNTNATITNFNSEHNGMGTITIDNVDALKTYTATLATASGAFKTFKLPAAKKEGITMVVENSNANRLFVMLDKTAGPTNIYNKLRVVAQINGNVVYNQLLNLDDGESTAPIAKKNLPAGIMQITVFDSLNIPLAERLVFINNFEIVKPTVALNLVNTTKKGHNKIGFDISNIAQASIAVAVVNRDVENSINVNDNIVSNLLLTSDLKGYIHQPGYYFANKDSATQHHLDLLMMTQGWRRFQWKSILAKEPVAIKYPIESAITLKGNVTKSDRTERVKDGKVSFMIKGEDSTSVLAEASITDKGEFLVTDVNFLKKATIAYMGTNNKQQGLIVDVHLDDSYIDSFTKSIHVPNVNIDTTNLKNTNNTWASYLQRRFTE